MKPYAGGGGGDFVKNDQDRNPMTSGVRGEGDQAQFTLLRTVTLKKKVF
jgi:hypothetical protein